MEVPASNIATYSCKEQAAGCAAIQIAMGHSNPYDTVDFQRCLSLSPGEYAAFYDNATVCMSNRGCSDNGCIRQCIVDANNSLGIVWATKDSQKEGFRMERRDDTNVVMWILFLVFIAVIVWLCMKKR